MAVCLHSMVDQGDAVRFPSPVVQLEDLSYAIPPKNRQRIRMYGLQDASRPLPA
jgi:hypothetical protein